MMDKKQRYDAAKALRKSKSQQDFTTADFTIPMEVWNEFLDFIASALELGVAENDLSEKTLEHISDTDFYKSCDAKVKTNLDSFLVSFVTDKVNKTIQPEEVVTVKVSDLKAMISSEVAKATQEITAKLKLETSATPVDGLEGKLVNALEKILLKKNVDEEQVALAFDPADVLKDFAVFFTYSIGMGIMDDSRNGMQIKSPYNRPILFHHLYRHEQMGRHRKEYINISVAKLSSKKEADWLRKHSLCGIKFFEDLNKVKDVDVFMQDKLVEANHEVSRLDDHNVVTRALNEGIAPNANIPELRKTLIFHIADIRMKEQGKRRMAIVERAAQGEKEIGELKATQS